MMDENTEKMKTGELSEELFVLKEVEWKIPISKIRLNFLDYDLQSPPFSFAGADWTLHLYPYGSTVSDSVGCIRIEIERLDSKISQHCVRYKSYFITQQGKKFNPIPVTRTFDSKCKIGWLFHIRKENFFLDEKIITAKDVLIFKCQMRTRKINGIEELSPTESSGTGLTESISRQESLLSRSNSKGLAESISRQESLLSRLDSKGVTEDISRQESILSRSVSKGVTEDISSQEAILSRSPSKESAEEISGQLLKKSVSTSTARATEIESSEEIFREDLESSISSSKGCDCTTRHSTLFPDNKMVQDFKDLFLKQEDCDVIIKVQGQEFPAHRNILRARSPVFASTFRNDMRERATGIVDIEDCDPFSFSDFLCFLYCGNTENLTADNVFSLFTVADKYDVKDLRSECLEFLKDNLSVDTFCETVTLAFQHFEKELIELTTDFFAKHLQEIIVTVKWQSFVVENPIQSNEIMIKSLVSNKK